MGQKKIIGISIASSIIVLIMGFGILLILWQSGTHNPSLPGLFDYLAATYGDAICLPLLVGALVCFRLNHSNPPQKWKRFEWIITCIAAIIGFLIQRSWLVSEQTDLNWTIPELHKFNAAGWWHAVFFVAMLALLGNLFTRFIYLKIKRTAFDNSLSAIAIQTLIWFSGSWFLFLHMTDDYVIGSNTFYILTITLGAILFFSLVVSIVPHAVLDRAVYAVDFIPLFSGILTAYALISVMLGTIEIDFFYLVSCALLIIVLVVPDTENHRKMILMYILIAAPTLLLEIALSVQKSIPQMLVVFLLAVITPCVIAVCQKDRTGYNILRKGIFASIIVLVYVSVLVIVFVLRDQSDYSELFEMLLNFVLVYAVPMYVNSSFDQIIAAEDSNNIELVRKLQPIMYTLYACVYAGAVILILRALFPDILWYRGGQVILSKSCYFSGGIVLTTVVCLALIGGFSKNRIDWKLKLVSCILLGIAYVSIAREITIVFLGEKILPLLTSSPLVFWLSIFVWIGYPATLALGFRNNIASIRGVRPDIWINITSIFIFGGTLITTVFAEYQMYFQNTTSAILINCVLLLLSAIVLPYLMGLIVVSSDLPEQVAKNTPAAGVAQDGLLFSMLAILSELLTVFFVGQVHNSQLNFAEITGLIISCVVYLSLMTWPLKFCLGNNIQHFKKRKLESEDSVEILAALLKHLRMQNINALLISFPYSVYLVGGEILAYGMGDSNNIISIISCFLPGFKDDSSN